MTKADLGNAGIQYLETWANLVRATGEIEDSTGKRRCQSLFANFIFIVHTAYKTGFLLKYRCENMK